MSKVNEGSRPVAKGRPGGGGVGGYRPESGGSLGTDTLSIDRDGAGLDWFWKALQTLRLKIAAIEAKFGMLPPPAPTPALPPAIGGGPARRDGPPPQSPEAPAKVVDGFRNVTSAPAKAADTAAHLVLSGVRLQIANRAGLEEAALAKLPPADRAAYGQVANLVETDAEGRSALQNLILSGKLASSPAAADGKSALSHLAQLSTQPLGENISRQKLVAHMLEELDDPTKIYQGNNNTCVPASVAILMARRHPAELVRLISGLASPGGTVRLASGESIRRHEDWRAPDGGRTIGQALLQPALMSYGVAWESLAYDNSRDRLSDGGNGLSAEEANVVFQGVTNRAATVVQFYDNRAGVDAAIDHIAKATAQGMPVPVGVTWTGSKGHKVLVEKIEKDRVYYTNPYGTQEYMTLTEFRKRITNANLPQL